jgi:hypothetical protein
MEYILTDHLIWKLQESHDVGIAAYSQEPAWSTRNSITYNSKKYAELARLIKDSMFVFTGQHFTLHKVNRSPDNVIEIVLTKPRQNKFQ